MTTEHRPLAYVAGPMTGDFEGNLTKAIDVADRLFVAGFAPVVPHLTIRWHQQHGHDYEEWMDYDFSLIARCNVLFRMPGKSPGADREVAFALQQHIPVFTDEAECAEYLEGR